MVSATEKLNKLKWHDKTVGQAPLGNNRPVRHAEFISASDQLANLCFKRHTGKILKRVQDDNFYEPCELVCRAVQDDSFFASRPVRHAEFSSASDQCGGQINSRPVRHSEFIYSPSTLICMAHTSPTSELSESIQCGIQSDDLMVGKILKQVQDDDFNVMTISPFGMTTNTVGWGFYPNNINNVGRIYQSDTNDKIRKVGAL